MTDEALAELERVPEEDRDHEDVAQLRVYILMRARRWDDALASCEAATAWLQQRMRTSPNEALPGATPFRRMMGLLAGAHYLATGALAAEEQLTRSGADKPFLTARVAVAQFFAEQILPQAGGLLGPVTRGASGPFALSGDEIGN
jgi:hypothetical protein